MVAGPEVEWIAYNVPLTASQRLRRPTRPGTQGRAATDLSPVPRGPSRPNCFPSNPKRKEHR
jgi:hypothetical protein